MDDHVQEGRRDPLVAATQDLTHETMQLAVVTRRTCQSTWVLAGATIALASATACLLAHEVGLM